MKRLLLLITASIATSICSGQNISLNLTHEFDGSSFSYGTTYLHDSGVALSFDRVQYYLCEFEITHDGGQQTTINDSYVLASSNITYYSVGTAAVTTIEGINFNLGVDSIANGLGIVNWAEGHPLSVQKPAMDWGWPAGYFFFIIDGHVDDTGDGIPNKIFEMRGVGNSLLRNVDLSALSITGNSIDMYVNVADWVRDLPMVTMGFEHNAGPVNTKIADNTNNETVFSIVSGITASDEEIEVSKNVVYANYSMPYAPTLFYQLNTTKSLSVHIYDMTGALVLSDDDLDPEGNYFIRKELMTGSYSAIFSNDELEERCRFVVQR
jgi:hypothetical protein